MLVDATVESKGEKREKLEGNDTGAISILLEKPVRIFRQAEQYTSCKSEKKGIPRRVLPFFPKTFHQDEPFHLNSPRNYRKFQSTGKRPIYSVLFSRSKINTSCLIVSISYFGSVYLQEIFLDGDLLAEIPFLAIFLRIVTPPYPPLA